VRFAAVVLVGVAVALPTVGCGGDDEGDDRAQITATLEQLFDAQERGDAETACSELYVIQEPERPGGEAGEAETGETEGEVGPGECEATFEHAQELREAEVRDLSTDVGDIEIEGDRATAIVHTELTRADGSPLIQEQPYDLVRTADGWRVRIADEG
jgi:hypothetical protein